MTRREGFILAATLWALVALTVVAAYINNVTRTNVDNADRAKRMLQSELDRRGTEATLLYLLSTNRMNHRNLVIESEQRFAIDDEMLKGDGDPTVSLASDPYQGLGDVAFSLQDETGLVSINTPSEPLLTRALVSLGIDAKTAAGLMPRIGDYIDKDRILTLDGAEDYDYARANLAPPANWHLATVMELNRVLGAEGMLDRAQWQRLRAMTTPRALAAINFNTMPPEVAAAVLEADVDDLADFLAAREEESLSRLDRIRELTGQYATVDPELIATVPSVFLRMTTWWQHGGPRTVVGITLTPSTPIAPPAAAPWRKEYRYSEPAAAGGPLRLPVTPLLNPKT
ncbi:MAG: type II secretion system protein GspK [Gammaproteobacteria bacterium]|nr:type II secretion system protein GspK [Gammaproteobacteria bacterium]